MITRPPNIAEQDSEPDLSLSTSIQNRESLEKAQLAASFSHTNYELFSGIENGLTKLKGNQLLDQKSLALIELLIRASKRGNELAAQMLASSRMTDSGTDP